MWMSFLKRNSIAVSINGKFFYKSHKLWTIKGALKIVLTNFNLHFILL